MRRIMTALVLTLAFAVSAVGCTPPDDQIPPTPGVDATATPRPGAPVATPTPRSGKDTAPPSRGR